MSYDCYFKKIWPLAQNINYFQFSTKARNHFLTSFRFPRKYFKWRNFAANVSWIGRFKVPAHWSYRSQYQRRTVKAESPWKQPAFWVTIWCANSWSITGNYYVCFKLSDTYIYRPFYLNTKIHTWPTISPL